MSTNPQTHSEIAVNPSKLAVTSATNAGDQQADVERKLKLYGVIQAFMNGNMPTNEQALEALDFAQTHSPVELEKLSSEGKVLVEDVRDIISTSKELIAEKNKNDLLQKLIYAGAQTDLSRGAKSKDQLVPVSKGEATEQGKQVAAHLRVLLTLLATNGEARKLIKDSGLIARDLFATGAAKVAESARPDQQALEHAEKAAPHGQFISEDGKVVGKDETPVLHLKGPSGTELKMNPKDDPANAQVTDHRGQTKTAGEHYDAAQQAKEDAKAQAAEAKEDAKAQGQQNLNQQGGVDGLKQQALSHAEDVRTADHPLDAAKAKKDQAAGQVGSTVDANTPDQAKDESNQKTNQLKDKVNEHKENVKGNVKGFLQDEFPEERREHFIYRLKKVVVECQDHKDYQEAVSYLIQLAGDYHGHAKTVAGHGADSAGAVAEDPALNQSTLMFRALLERFANNQSSQPIIDSVDQLYTDAQNDQELRQWWSSVGDYAQRALLEPGYIMEEESDQEAQALIDKGKFFFQDKYKGHFDTFSDNVSTFFNAMGEDPLNKRFGEDWKRLIRDLLFDAEGNLTVKPKLWNDIRSVILPQVIKQVGYVPIPRAEYSDKSIELVIENLVLQGENLMPNLINIESFNKFAFSPYEQITKNVDTSHHEFTVGLHQIQADLRDVHFAFRRHSGFPKISDSGLADVLIGGKGINVTIRVETVEGKRDSVFRVGRIDIDIDTLKFSIRDSKHDLLYKFIKSTATRLIKKAIEAAIHAAISAALNNLDDQLAEVRNRVNDAKESDETTRAQALKDLYARKKQTAAENKQKAEETAKERDSQFKIVLDPQDSIVKDLDEKNTKNSWSRRALHIQEAAATAGDDGWKSPVFSLFSKNHPATTGVAHPNTTNSSAGQLHTGGKTVAS